MYSDLQRERSDIESIIAHPDYLEGNPDLIKPKKLINPVKASKSHQELHRELLMNHKRGMSIDNKPELQRVLQHRRRDQLIRQKKEEEEAKKLMSPFEQELLKRHQRLEQSAGNVMKMKLALVEDVPLKKTVIHLMIEVWGKSSCIFTFSELYYNALAFLGSIRASSLKGWIQLLSRLCHLRSPLS
ncbi:actin-associated protein FAM107A isoform X2 [Rhinatrema bivittatum]|nr:actin-associated protein FAM107A isoform X2 [Rhinatrema bivittatum]